MCEQGGNSPCLAGLNLPHAQVMTCCNTGSLATSGYGTALGVVRALHADGKLQHVFATETRPYNQVCAPSPSHPHPVTRALSSAVQPCVCVSAMTRVERRWPERTYFLLSREEQRASGVSL